jgi:hypothetical protein
MLPLGREQDGGGVEKGGVEKDAKECSERYGGGVGRRGEGVRVGGARVQGVYPTPYALHRKLYHPLHFHTQKEGRKTQKRGRKHPNHP